MQHSNHKLINMPNFLERFKIALVRFRVAPIIFAKSSWLSLGTGRTLEPFV
jgi:hypothetical protein